MGLGRTRVRACWIAGGATARNRGHVQVARALCSDQAGTCAFGTIRRSGGNPCKRGRLDTTRLRPALPMHTHETHDDRLAPATHVQAVQHVKPRAYTSRTNLQLSRDTWVQWCRRASASLLPCHIREGLIESLHKRFQEV